MANSYTKNTPKMWEDNQIHQPSNHTLNKLLNYSKSIEVKQAKFKFYLIHLN